ncbi:tonsoku-like protein, partial [Mercenaria mercenaria]|uniref:tonsoku-like protein n=1 Tax=Mercenaria mercenaria TaxID=6596 RepID=UPI00234EEFD2
HVHYRNFSAYKKQRFKAERKGNLENEARVSNYIGDIYEKYGEFETAVEEHERALRLREVLGRKIDIAVAFRTLGECYCKKKDYEKAHSLHEKYLSLARECDDLVEKQRALTTIGNTFLEQSNERSFSMKTRRGASKKAENVYLKSLEICDQLKATIDEKEFIDMKARNFYNLGLVYDGLEDSDTSRQYLNKALSLCQKHYLLDMLYVCQKALGDIYLKCNKLEDAGKFLDEAYTTAKKLKNKALETDALWLKMQKVSKYRICNLIKVICISKCWLNQFCFSIEEFFSFVISVLCMEKTMESMRKINKEDLLGRIPHYDKLGDCAVDLKMYDLAISYYNKVLTASIAVNKERKELIPTYISLAQTYSDCFQYDKAIVYYKKEIECYGDDNHEQICRSWLNIAAYEEKNDVDYKKVQNSYVNAHNAAKKAGNRRLQSHSGVLRLVGLSFTSLSLQCRALSCLVELFKIHKDEKSLKKAKDQLDHIKSKYNIVDMEYEEESQVTEDDDTDFGDFVNTEDEVEMSDLTESEEDEEMVVKTVRMARRNGKRVKEQKRNDFGETPLHRACIKGELQKVKQLIAEGHPVNVQDNSGWIPLHEAANNNWYDITEYLLQHGADINHRGGPKCQGMTPLIDAASVGWLDIVELLLKYGANALAKDDHQMTALDHLMKLREENGEVDRKTEIQFNNIIGMLREKTPVYRGTSRNKVLTQSKPAALVPESESYSQNLPTITRKPKADKKRQSRNDVIVDSDSDSDGSLIRNSRNKSRSPVHMDTENSYQSFSDDPDDYDQCATDAYKQAISKVGRSACRANQSSQPKSSRRTSNPDGPALIAEEDFIENDWLIDDLKPTKAKKVDVNGYLSTGNIRKRSRSGSLSPLPYPERLKRDSHSSQKKRIKIVESDSESESGVGQELGSNENPRLTDITNTVSDDKLDNTVIGNNDVDVIFNDYDSDAEKVPPKQLISATKSANNNFFVKKNPQKQLKLTDFGGSITTATTRTHFNDRIGTQSEQNSAIIINQSVGESNSAINREKPLNNVIRVKVNVEGVLLLIPVVDNDGTKTFSWLAEEAATRYYKMRGVKLKLTLGKDGAHFSPEDLVSLLLVDNDLVESFVDSKDEQPPMAESYKNACSTLKTVCYKNVSMLLQSCEVSGKLCLGDLALRPTRFQPVVRAIQHQTCLRELDLKGNRICDTGLENLCKVLNTVPNLVYLGLACND